MDDDPLKVIMLKRASLIEQGELAAEETIAGYESMLARLRETAARIAALEPEIRSEPTQRLIGMVDREIASASHLAASRTLPNLTEQLAAITAPSGTSRTRDLVWQLEFQASALSTLAALIKIRYEIDESGS